MLACATRLHTFRIYAYDESTTCSTDMRTKALRSFMSRKGEGASGGVLRRHLTRAVRIIRTYDLWLLNHEIE